MTVRIAIAVIIAISVVGLYISYILWRRAKGRLMKRHSSSDEEGKRRANTTNPTADKTPITYGHLESVPNATVQASPTTNPPTTPRIISCIVSPIIRVYKRSNHASINKEQNRERALIFIRRSLVQARGCARISSQRKMPIYEYWCDCCRRVVSSYRRNPSAASPPCPRCGNGGLTRIFSTFSLQKTYRDVYEDILSDRELSQGMMRDDPRAIAEWNKRMSSGEKSPPEYEEITERMERGEWPASQIEEKREEFSGRRRGKPKTD